MRSLLRPGLYLLLLVFAGFCLHLLRRDLAQLPQVDLGAQGGAVALCAGLSLLNYALRVLRWHVFMARLGHSFSLLRNALYYVAGFAFTLSPGKLGELARIRYYQRHGVGAAPVTAAFFVERLQDLVAILLLAVVGLASYTRESGYGALFVVAGLMVVAAVALTAWLPWSEIEARSQSRSGTVGRLLGKLAHTMVQARTLSGPGLLLSGCLIGLLAWGSEGVGLGVLGALAPQVPLDFGSAAGIYAVAVLAGALSFLPGGLGGTEAVMIALLHAWGLPPGSAILLTLLCRLLTLWLAVLIGWTCVLLLRLPRFAP